MIYPPHFRRLVIRPALQKVGLHSDAAENLLLGTALAESQLYFLRQGWKTLDDGRGRALGVYQVEPATHEDIYQNFLVYQDKLSRKVLGLWPRAAETIDHNSLITDLGYATVIARLVYYRRPEPLPDANDAEGLARYHEVHFNTKYGDVGKTPDLLEKINEFSRVVRGGRFEKEN